MAPKSFVSLVSHSAISDVRTTIDDFATRVADAVDLPPMPSLAASAWKLAFVMVPLLGAGVCHGVLLVAFVPDVLAFPLQWR